MSSSPSPFFAHSEPKWIIEDNKPPAHSKEKLRCITSSNTSINTIYSKDCRIAPSAHRLKKPQRAWFLLLGFSVRRLRLLCLRSLHGLLPTIQRHLAGGFTLTESYIPANITFIEEKASRIQNTTKDVMSSTSHPNGTPSWFSQCCIVGNSCEQLENPELWATYLQLISSGVLQWT